MLPKRFILLALLSACPALANTIIVTSLDYATGRSVRINLDGHDTQLGWAGGGNIEVDGYSRLVFCVDLLTGIDLNVTYNTTMDFSDTIHDGDFTDVPYLQRAGWLLQTQNPTTPLLGAALQLAIWDIVTDRADGFGTLTKGAGIVSRSTDGADSDVIAAAIIYEDASALHTSSDGMVYHNYTFSGTAVQTLMGHNATDGGPSPTPEPAAIFLTLSGLALIGLSRLRRGAKGQRPR